MKTLAGIALAAVLIVVSNMMSDHCVSSGQARRDAARRESDHRLQVARDEAAERIRLADEQDRAKAAMIHQVVDDARQVLVKYDTRYDAAPTSSAERAPSDQTQH